MRTILSCTALLAALACTVEQAASQTQTLPRGFDTTECNSSTGFFTTATARHKWHWVYDSAQFDATAPIRITRIELRANGGVTTRPSVTYNNFDVRVGPSQNDYQLATQSTTFANNWVGGTPPATAFFNGSLTTNAGAGATTPSPWGEFVIDAQNPVIYDPTLGQDLIIQIRTPANGVGTLNPVWATGDGQTGTAGAVRGNRYGHTSDPDALVRNFQNNEFVPVVRITYTPAVGLYADFSATPTSGASPLNVQFTDTTYSSDPGGVTSWAWDLDGDSFIDSNAQNPSFIYNSCGRYSVTLTVTDASNPQSSLTKNQLITVDPQLVVSASFTVTPNVGQCPLVANFTDTSTGTPTHWAWDFNGDNVIDSNAQNPSYTYTTAGAFNVTLTASNACGSSTRTINGAVACVANDECTTAIPLALGLNGPFNTAGATSSASAWPCASGGSDIWFVYSASQNSTVEINACTGGNYDSALQALVGDCSGPFVSIACNDDSCGLLSRISYPACRNAPVWIRLGGFNGARGVCSLEVIETPNTGGSFTTVGTTCGGPTMTASGIPQLGEQVNYAMSGSVAIPFITFGFSAINAPLCTAGCILGPNPEYAVYARSLSATVPCDRTAIGATIYLQGLDIGAFTGCGPIDPLLVATTETIVTVIG